MPYVYYRTVFTLPWPYDVRSNIQHMISNFMACNHVEDVTDVRVVKPGRVTIDSRGPYVRDIKTLLALDYANPVTDVCALGHYALAPYEDRLLDAIIAGIVGDDALNLDILPWWSAAAVRGRITRLKGRREHSYVLRVPPVVAYGSGVRMHADFSEDEEFN